MIPRLRVERGSDSGFKLTKPDVTMALLQGAQMTDPEQNDIGWQPIPCPISISVNKAPDAGHFCRQ